MQRIFTTLLAAATISVSAPAFAQSYAADTQPAAPIERQYQQTPPPANYQQQPQTRTTQPAQGIWLVAAPDAQVETISTTADRTELRLMHGRANVNVHHPADHSEILVDLPGGQVSLLKDGLYTFNAETNTVRVLRGEADVYAGSGKPVTVKEEHQLVVGANATHAQEADRNQLRADLLQGNYAQGSEGYRHGDGYGYREGFYGYAPYAYGWPYYGFYGPGFGYPYYAFGGPWGYPYGYGFGLGLSFGYYGGFRGGYAFRGGYGGFRGGYGFRR